MLWPIVLPFKITFWSLTAFVVFVTAIAPVLKWKRAKTLFVSTLLAMLAFIPSCTGMMYLVDGMRFGYFEYATFDDVNDFRAERYLPTAASRRNLPRAYAAGADGKSRTSDNGDPADDIDATDPMTSHHYERAGTYQALLRVIDAGDRSHESTVQTTVSMDNLPPTSDAGGPCVSSEVSPPRLNARASTDPNGPCPPFLQLP